MVFSALIQGVKLQGWRSPNAQTRRPNKVNAEDALVRRGSFH